MSREKKAVANVPKKLVYVDDAPVFKFINPNSNDKLSEMSGLDLQDLIILINEYYIQLRNQLGLEQYITFGLELEFENAKKDKIDMQLREAFENGEWQTKPDGSLLRGAEINSPVLRDTKANWKNLNKVCSIVRPLASIDKKSGGHIHIGVQTLGSERQSWLNFIKMWSVYENIIFRFVYGDHLTARPSILTFAKPMAEDFWQDYKKLKSENASLNAIISKIAIERNQAVNFKNILSCGWNDFKAKNTIEFRCPNGSLDAAIWQNNVNLFVRMLCYSKSTLFNDDLVEQRHQLNLNKFAELKFYDEIYLEQALELCDMIFFNNYDKVAFLKQYLKTVEVYKKNTNYTKTYTLTKKE